MYMYICIYIYIYIYIYIFVILAHLYAKLLQNISVEYKQNCAVNNISLHRNTHSYLQLGLGNIISIVHLVR